MLGDAGLRLDGPLREGHVLRERGRCAVLRAGRLRIARALHCRGLLCEHHGFAVLDDRGLWPELVVRRRHVQLSGA